MPNHYIMKFVLPLLVLLIGCRNSVCEKSSCPNSGCSIISPTVDIPVTATDAYGYQRDFTNCCAMERYNKRYKTYYTSDSCGAQTPPGKCDTFCTQDYIPVCAVDPWGKRKNVSNCCVVESYNECYNTKYTVASCEARTSPCEYYCPAVYQPVWGEDSNGNELKFDSCCELEAYNECYCNNFKSPFCCEQPPDKCQTSCTKEYFPVTATDSNGNEKDFSNCCEITRYNRCYDTGFASKYCNNTADCSIVCQEGDDNPVWAKDSCGNQKRFLNCCDLTRYNRCNLTDYCSPCCDSTLQAPACNRLCPFIYSPVTGVDNCGHTKTFGNYCLLGAFNACHLTTYQTEE